MRHNESNHNSLKRTRSRPEPFIYEIKVQGELGELWSQWFEGMTLTVFKNSDSGGLYTIISGPVVDQPALHGLLNKIRDLNLTLIAVHRYIPGTNTVEQISGEPEPSGDQEDIRKDN